MTELIKQARTWRRKNDSGCVVGYSETIANLETSGGRDEVCLLSIWCRFLECISQTPDPAGISWNLPLAGGRAPFLQAVLSSRGRHW